MLPGEIGCLLSHRSVTAWFSGCDKASLLVVLEDNVIPSSSDFYDQLYCLVVFLEREAASGGAFVCHLGPREGQWKKSFSRKVAVGEELSGACSLYSHCGKEKDIWLAHAYVISKEAALRYSTLSVSGGFLADDWGRVAEQAGIHLLSIFPGIFSQAEEFSSSIDLGNTRSMTYHHDSERSTNKKACS